MRLTRLPGKLGGHVVITPDPEVEALKEQVKALTEALNEAREELKLPKVVLPQPQDRGPR
jgi:hypothetical protein